MLAATRQSTVLPSLRRSTIARSSTGTPDSRFLTITSRTLVSAHSPSPIADSPITSSRSKPDSRVNPSFTSLMIPSARRLMIAQSGLVAKTLCMLRASTAISAASRWLIMTTSPKVHRIVLAMAARNAPALTGEGA